VIVRGMLNCNQVVLRDRGNNVLVDSGYCTHRERTLALLAGPEGLEGEPLARLVNTHCHTDHMGGNAAVARAYGCRIAIPAGEAKHVDPWTQAAGSSEFFDHQVEPFRFDETLRPGERFAGAGFEWHVHAAPGHDMEALMFFEPRHRVLISGDALWENGMGIVWPERGATSSIDASLHTLARIEELDPAIVIPGHGKPFEGVAGALARARGRLDAFARDPARNARHIVKALFAFALLDRGSMVVEEAPAYLARVPCYRALAETFLALDCGALAAWLLPELERVGAARIARGEIRPTAAT
jgi:glyoxylase-like metal-dependent hydrolase (beta-lactamase superfamily II)